MANAPRVADSHASHARTLIVRSSLMASFRKTTVARVPLSTTWYLPCRFCLTACAAGLVSEAGRGAVGTSRTCPGILVSDTVSQVSRSLRNLSSSSICAWAERRGEGVGKGEGTKERGR